MQLAKTFASYVLGRLERLKCGSNHISSAVKQFFFLNWNNFLRHQLVTCKSSNLRSCWMMYMRHLLATYLRVCVCVCVCLCVCVFCVHNTES